jgi:hypothetical protein
MKFNKWTMGLAAVGVVSLASAARADETKMTQVQTALSNTTLSGYVDVAAQWNAGSQNANRAAGIGGVVGMPAYAFGGIGKADGFNLNAVDLALDKPMDESPWAAGYHVEMMFGPDSVPLGNTALKVGGVGIPGGAIVGGLGANSLRQAYLTLRTPVANSGIDWKVGVFDTIIGYESSSDPLNPNYTRSYGYSMEPTTETGILATYKINDMVSVSAGIANTANSDAIYATAINVSSIVRGTGLNNRAALESQKAYLASIALTAPDSAGFMKGATFNAGIIEADNGARGTTANGTTSIYAGVTVPTPMTALKVGAAFDFLELHNGGAGAQVPIGVAANASDDSVWNIGLYGNFQINDKASFNLRAEYLNDNGAGPYFGTYTTALSPATGGNNAEELTATLQYNLWANVLSRLEVRWDHVEHGKAFDLTGVGPVSPAHDSAFMLALNLIYQF